MKTQIILSLTLLLTGNLLRAQIETKIPTDSLPLPVKEQLHKNFHDYSFSKAVKMNMPGGAIHYSLVAGKEKNPSVTVIYELTYDAAGNILSKEKSKSFTYDSSKEPKPKSTYSNDRHGGHQH